MIGRALRWNRLVFPPWWAVVAFLPFFLFCEAALLYVGLLVHPPGNWWFRPLRDFKEVEFGRWLVAGVAVAFYVAYRVSFHPVYRSDYRTWLANTPWNASKPLPLGPVHLIPQDLAVLALLLLLMHTVGRQPLLLIFGFFFAYQLALALTVLIAGERWMAYGLLFALAIALTLAQSGVFGIMAVALIYPLTHWANRECLARFPWGMKEFMGSLQNAATKTLLSVPRELADQQKLGFPHQFLSPKVSVRSISRAEGTAISLLAALWCHAIVTNCPDAESQRALAGLLMLPVGFSIIARFLLYCGRYWPPISLWGRIRTGRYVIPRYDRVLVAPILAAVVLLGGVSLVDLARLRTTPGMPIVIAISLWINVCLGPRLLDWRLTGGHRLGLGIRNRQLYAEP